MGGGRIADRKKKETNLRGKRSFGLPERIRPGEKKEKKAPSRRSGKEGDWRKGKKEEPSLQKEGNHLEEKGRPSPLDLKKA